MAKAADIQAQRRTNLKRIVKEPGGGPSSLAKTLGLSGPSFVSQMTSGNRTISDKTARRVEEATGKPIYWMDHDHTSDQPARTVVTDPSFINAAVQAVVAVQQELNAQISAAKYAEIVELVYSLAQKDGAVSADYARKLVKLTM